MAAGVTILALALAAVAKGVDAQSNFVAGAHLRAFADV